MGSNYFLNVSERNVDSFLRNPTDHSFFARQYFPNLISVFLLGWSCQKHFLIRTKMEPLYIYIYFKKKLGYKNIKEQRWKVKSVIFQILSDWPVCLSEVLLCQGSQRAANQRGSQRLTKHAVLPLPSCKTICQTPVVLFELDLALRSQTVGPLLCRTKPAPWWQGDKMRTLLSYTEIISGSLMGPQRGFAVIIVCPVSFLNMWSF